MAEQLTLKQPGLNGVLVEWWRVLFPFSYRLHEPSGRERCTLGAMPLFERRRDREARAARAAAGKPRSLQDGFDQAARAKLVYALGDSTPSSLTWAEYPFSQVDANALFTTMRGVLLREWGVPPSHMDNVPMYLVNAASDDEVRSIIEAWFLAIRQLAEQIGSRVIYTDGYSPNDRAVAELGQSYRTKVNEVLDDHDIAWQLVGPELVPRTSMVMHATIVEPVASLLAGRKDLAAVETAYMKALSELKPGGDPTDAITDAGTALQEMLRALGCRGEQLGPLFADARQKGVVGPYDSKIAAALEALGDWAAAERSQRGDGHRATGGSVEDAWLAVRIAGALIVRLAAGKR